jgi:hypothetical protein
MMGMQWDDFEGFEYMNDRHVNVASQYTATNAMSTNGLAGFYGNIMDQRVKSAFHVVANDDAKWAAFCHHVVSNNSWALTQEKCTDGLNGMRNTIINEGPTEVGVGARLPMERGGV